MIKTQEMKSKNTKNDFEIEDFSLDHYEKNLKVYLQLRSLYSLGIYLNKKILSIIFMNSINFKLIKSVFEMNF